MTQEALILRVSDCLASLPGLPFVVDSVILSARVPVIKCFHRATGIKLDVICNEIAGLAQIRLFEKANRVYPQFKFLYLFFKFFLRQRGLNSTYTGGIGGAINSRQLPFVCTCRDFSPRVSQKTQKKKSKSVLQSSAVVGVFAGVPGFFRSRVQPQNARNPHLRRGQDNSQAIQGLAILCVLFPPRIGQFGHTGLSYW